MISETDWITAEKLCNVSETHPEFAKEAKRLLPLLLSELKRITDVEAKLIRFGKAVGAKRIEELEDEVQNLETHLDKLCLALARYRREI